MTLNENVKRKQEENKHWVEIHHQAVDKLGEIIVLITMGKAHYASVYAFIHEIKIQDKHPFEFSTWKKKVVVETAIITIKQKRENAASYQNDYIILRGNLFNIESVTDRGGNIVEMSIKSVRIEDRL